MWMRQSARILGSVGVGVGTVSHLCADSKAVICQEAPPAKVQRSVAELEAIVEQLNEKNKILTSKIPPVHPTVQQTPKCRIWCLLLTGVHWKLSYISGILRATV